MWDATSITAWSSQTRPFSAVATVASPITPDSVHPLHWPLIESGPSFQSIHTVSESQSGIVEFSVRLAQDLKPQIRAALQ